MIIAFILWAQCVLSDQDKNISSGWGLSHDGIPQCKYVVLFPAKAHASEGRSMNSRLCKSNATPLPRLCLHSSSARSRSTGEGRGCGVNNSVEWIKCVRSHVIITPKTDHFGVTWGQPSNNLYCLPKTNWEPLCPRLASGNGKPCTHRDSMHFWC